MIEPRMEFLVKFRIGRDRPRTSWINVAETVSIQLELKELSLYSVETFVLIKSGGTIYEFGGIPSRDI